MNLEDVKYDAFISYRHCELDKFVAENLHKQLEAFKIPKALVASGKTNGKTKIERVFRDRDELPLASNLADPITQALEHSDYLIVICSPRLPESKWCLKEIETFISMHGREHILAVLVEGEPVDSFPDILRFEELEVTDADGNVHIEKREVEPLAADVRGKDKKEVLKQIKSELLRLVAPIIDCNYDDLKMRHKEAHQKKILQISLGVSAVCITFAAVSTTMALTIHKQAGTIEKQYKEALETQAVSYAKTSGTLLKEEDCLAAIAIARMALPDTIADQKDKPYTPEAEYALANSLSVYSTGRYNQAVSTLEQNSQIQLMLVSPEENTLTTVDTHSQITVYDVATATVLQTFALPSDKLSSIDEGGISYLDNTHLVILTGDGYCIFDIQEGKASYVTMEGDFQYLKCSKDGEYIALSGWHTIKIVKAEGEEVFAYQIPDNLSGDLAMNFDTDNKLFAFTASIIGTEPEGENNGLVGLVDLKDKKLLRTFDVAPTVANQIAFYKDQLIYSGSSYIGEGIVDYQVNADVYAFSLTEDKVNWTYHKEDANSKCFTAAQSWNTPWIALYGYSEIEFINCKDGSSAACFDLDSKILDVAPLEEDGNVLAFTEDGNRMFIQADPDSSPYTIEEYDVTNGRFSEYSFQSTMEAAFRNRGTSVTIYRHFPSPMMEDVEKADDYLRFGAYSSDNSMLAAVDISDNLYLYNTNSKEMMKPEYAGGATESVFFTEDGSQLVVVDNESVMAYSTEDGKLISNTLLKNDWMALTGNEITTLEYVNTSIDGAEILYFDKLSAAFYRYSVKENKLTLACSLEKTESNMEMAAATENLSQAVVLSEENNTLSAIDVATGKCINSMDVNASLITKMICSEKADCLMVVYLDETVNVYRLSDFTLLDTFTGLQDSIIDMKYIDIDTDGADSEAPSYVLCGWGSSYLLNDNLKMVASCSKYLGYDSKSQKFYFASGTNIVAISYYSYDMLIQEADKQLSNYEMSERKKNQLGIE